jgi:hypothetical protein
MLMAFKLRAIFTYLYWRGVSVFLVSSKEPPHLVASYNRQGDAEDLHVYSNPDPHSVASYNT